MKIQISFMTRSLLTLSASSLLLASCVSSPSAPEGAADARMRLTNLQQNSELSSRAPEEIRAADLAVRAAERPNRDPAVSLHRVLIAGQMIDIADAWAHSRLYEDQRRDLAERSDNIRLDARTREADLARRDATAARDTADEAVLQAGAAQDQARLARTEASVERNSANEARSQADAARDQARLAITDANSERDAATAARDEAGVAQDQAVAARLDAERARTEAEQATRDAETVRSTNDELRLQIAALNARPTDRGLVVTLGDVLFQTGSSDLIGGSQADLDRLVSFLNSYPERTVVIEGHTDSVGTEDSNQLLSQSRAESVRAYLAGRGISSSRLVAFGKGESTPVSTNDSTTGRQQNRRVEVIISDTP